MTTLTVGSSLKLLKERSRLVSALDGSIENKEFTLLELIEHLDRHNVVRFEQNDGFSLNMLLSETRPRSSIEFFEKFNDLSEFVARVCVIDDSDDIVLSFCVNLCNDCM
jgi:hypothetical protein